MREESNMKNAFTKVHTMFKSSNNPKGLILLTDGVSKERSSSSLLRLFADDTKEVIEAARLLKGEVCTSLTLSL